MEASDYKVAGLSLQRAAIAEQLARVPSSDTFARLLLMGKLKAITRELNDLPTKDTPSHG